MNALALSSFVAARRDAGFTLVPPQRSTKLRPRRRRLICRWRRDPRSGLLVCVWSEEGVEANPDRLRQRDLRQAA
ncbi:MAG: hypothetical protein WAK01_19425 [Methylocystis sp.]